ncbi:MAG: iojap-like protein [Verrucomicrobia bacterium]|jgi:ribosome-associated protein|nr:iojap-like protein [Verrucomicrobiota bacterium]
MESKKLALACREYADNRKAENIVVLDMRPVSTIADYFIIVTGSSEPHLRAISDEIETKVLQNFGVRPRAIDGTVQGSWMVLDYFDVIVHIMKTDARERYDIEALWNDAPRVDLKATMEEAEPTPATEAAPKPKKKAAAKKTIVKKAAKKAAKKSAAE